jgi:hypothetical protein
MGRSLPRTNQKSNWMFAAVLLVFVIVSLAAAQDGKDKDKPKAGDEFTRLRIEVTGGDAEKPVPDASVYVKFTEDRKLRKDKKFELNLKTNEEGVTRTPDIPQGRVLIQIVAPGWKTYGEYFELNQAEQTIPIHLARPARPY